MITEEYFKYRQDLLTQSTDDQGFIQESILLSEVLPSMLDSKLIDSEDSNSSYINSSSGNFKVNSYCVNESGERLQLFIVDESSIDLTRKEDQLMVSKKSDYEAQFKRCHSFVNKALKGYLNDEIQDSSPVRPLVAHMSSSDGVHQFDVIEIFLISLTATVSLQGATPQPKRIDFDDDSIKMNYTKSDRSRHTKELTIKKRLIDLNFLYNVLISQGNREALVVDFEKLFGHPISAIKAADEDHFESYLCVLPAKIIAGLYKDFSTRLLEKNVRSFLQFRGVNKGIRETIRKEPEKFVAYNNGLTITATAADITINEGQSSIKSLTDFQIVNGGQTTATIYFTHKDGFDIDRVKVMAKINIAKETTEEELEELISNISTFSNAQSKVSKVDLRSRNPQLVKIKSLSESVLTPSGKKWFFERAKGEFNTKLRISGSNKNRLAKEFPTERRFSKELMAKYYSSWGDQPHLVKKGGEKIFRFFIEKLTGENETKRKKPIDVNRTFYEELIAKIILFRSLEKIYGSGKNSMGQLRSAVVPYSLGILYSITDGNSKGRPFDLLKIWLNEGLEDDLSAYFTELLKLMNELIKKYSDSDDFGEYSKKEELWNRIKGSSEIAAFVGTPSTEQVLNKYCLTKEEAKKRQKIKKSIEVNFDDVTRSVMIFSKGAEYFKELIKLSKEHLTDKEVRKLANISSCIKNKQDLTLDLIQQDDLIHKKLRVSHPSVFDKIELPEEDKLSRALNYVIKKYNDTISNQGDFVSDFQTISVLAESKGVKYSSVYSEIGKQFKKGDPPNIKQLLYASENIHILN